MCSLYGMCVLRELTFMINVNGYHLCCVVPLSAACSVVWLATWECSWSLSCGTPFIYVRMTSLCGCVECVIIYLPVCIIVHVSQFIYLLYIICENSTVACSVNGCTFCSCYRVHRHGMGRSCWQYVCQHL